MPNSRKNPNLNDGAKKGSFSNPYVDVLVASLDGNPLLVWEDGIVTDFNGNLWFFSFVTGTYVPINHNFARFHRNLAEFTLNLLDTGSRGLVYTNSSECPDDYNIIVGISDTSADDYQPLSSLDKEKIATLPVYLDFVTTEITPRRLIVSIDPKYSIFVYKLLGGKSTHVFRLLKPCVGDIVFVSNGAAVNVYAINSIIPRGNIAPVSDLVGEDIDSSVISTGTLSNCGHEMPYTVLLVHSSSGTPSSLPDVVADEVTTLGMVYRPPFGTQIGNNNAWYLVITANDVANSINATDTADHS